MKEHNPPIIHFGKIEQARQIENKNKEVIDVTEIVLMDEVNLKVSIHLINDILFLNSGFQ